MKNSKTTTEAVYAANRANAQASTGPKTKSGKSTSSKNAVGHGILSKKIVLNTKEERREFRKLKRRCRNQFKPRDFLENFFVDEVIINIWKLGIIEELEAQDLLRRQGIDNDVNGIFNFKNDLEIPFEKDDIPLQCGWDCERMVVRGTAVKDLAQTNAASGPQVVNGQPVQGFKAGCNAKSDSAHHLEVEAVLVSTLDRMSRYKSSVKKDLYRAIEALKQLQEDRKKKHGTEDIDWYIEGD